MNGVKMDRNGLTLKLGSKQNATNRMRDGSK